MAIGGNSTIASPQRRVSHEIPPDRRGEAGAASPAGMTMIDPQLTHVLRAEGIPAGCHTTSYIPPSLYNITHLHIGTTAAIITIIMMAFISPSPLYSFLRIRGFNLQSREKAHTTPSMYTNCVIFNFIQCNLYITVTQGIIPKFPLCGDSRYAEIDLY